MNPQENDRRSTVDSATEGTRPASITEPAPPETAPVELLDADLPMVTVVSSYAIALRCEECDRTFIVYDPNAERGHEVAVADLVSDVRRHASKCGES